MATVHLVSHTHWDREWYLPFQTFRLRLVRLIDGLLDLLAGDPEYRSFMLDGQTIVLDDYLALRPERAEEIRHYVRSGRLLIGPWHVLPDEFLVSPEATVRNLLQGKRTAGQFGPRMDVGYIPDPFGHIGQMPQVLGGFGITVGALRRGLADEPCELWWQSPDGSRMLLAYLRDGYDNAAGLRLETPADLEPFPTAVRRLCESLAPFVATGQVLLMHGTDHMEPQPYTSAALAHARDEMGGDVLLHSTLPAYLDAVCTAICERQLDIPVVAGELRSPKRHHLLPGVLSTRMWIKQRNQACETLLEKWAEPFGAWAALEAQCTLPLAELAPVLRHAWRLLMECHPHDSICGCSVDQVHEEMRPRFDQVEQVGEEIVGQSLSAIAAAADTDPSAALGEGWVPVVVFNPVAGPRTDVVVARWAWHMPLRAVEVVDEGGTVLPSRVVEVQREEVDRRVLDRAGLLALLHSVRGGRIQQRAIGAVSLQREGETLSIDVALSGVDGPHAKAASKGLQRVREAAGDLALKRFVVQGSSHLVAVEFVARDVPGNGYRTFWLRPLAPPSCPSSGREDGPARIENEFLSAEVSADGTLCVTDLRTGFRLAGLNRFADGGDCGDEYNYSPPEQDTVVVAAHPALVACCADPGSARQSLEVIYELPVPAALAGDRRSRSRERVVLTVRTVASLVPGVPRLDVVTEVENRARDHRLRVHFPVPFAVAHADHDGHYEVVRRPVGPISYDDTWVEWPCREVPQRAFTDVSDGAVGLMVANRGLPEVAVLPTEGGGCEIALTLLRCVGWLSRADFPSRRGHAGPHLPTPGAQMAGRYRFEYAVIPHRGEWPNAYREAYAFAAPLRAVVAAAHPGTLPRTAVLVHVEPEAFVLSAIKPAEDGSGLVLRGYNIGSQRLQVSLRPWRACTRATRVRLDEAELEELALDTDGRLSLEVRGHEIVTIKLLW